MFNLRKKFIIANRPYQIDCYKEQNIFSTESPNNLSSKSEFEGSLRFNKNDLLKMNLNLDSFDVKKNTLLIADVSGLHSRSLGEVNENKSLRIGIHGNIRHYKIF